MEKWSKVENDKIVITVKVIDKKVVSIISDEGIKENYRGLVYDLGRGNQSTFSAQDFIGAGWLLHDYDIPGEYQYPVQNLIIEGDRINREIVDKTGDEILDEKVGDFTSGVQGHLDQTAQSWGYDSIISLCSYATDPNPVYSGEALAAVSWRGQVWQYCYGELQKIKDGDRSEPESVESFITELPVIERP